MNSGDILRKAKSGRRRFVDTIYIVSCAAALVAFASPSPADTCVAETTICTERGDIEVGGVRLTDVCLQTERSEHCTRDAPADSCAGFAVLSAGAADPLEDNQCKLVSETCTRSVNGLCDSWDREYRCWNGPAESLGADLVSRQYRNFAETIASDCATLQGDASCSFVETVTLQGAGSRLINEYPINRLWWEREQRYSCAGVGPVDTCGPIQADPVCKENAEPVCTTFGADGSCEVWSRSFHCYADPSLNAACQEINICEGENCTGAPEEPDEDYANAATWLNFLDQAAKQNTCTNDAADPVYEGEMPDVDHCENDIMDLGNALPEIFEGRRMTCDRGLNNCCDNDFEGSCSASEIELTHLRIGGQTHFLRSRCTSSFLGICLNVREYHCAYNSKFARVFQEQAHLQTGSQFDGYNSPYCPGLAVEDLETLDVGIMDLTEVFGDMLASVSLPVEELVMQRLAEDMGLLQTDVGETFGNEP